MLQGQFWKVIRSLVFAAETRRFYDAFSSLYRTGCACGFKLGPYCCSCSAPCPCVSEGSFLQGTGVRGWRQRAILASRHSPRIALNRTNVLLFPSFKEKRENAMDNLRFLQIQPWALISQKKATCFCCWIRFVKKPRSKRRIIWSLSTSNY